MSSGTLLEIKIMIRKTLIVFGTGLLLSAHLAAIEAPVDTGMQSTIEFPAYGNITAAIMQPARYQRVIEMRLRDLAPQMMEQPTRVEFPALAEAIQL
jgi:hypothetical protein